MPQPTFSRIPGYLTYVEAANEFGCCERTIRNLIKRGLLKRHGAVRPYRVSEEDVKKLAIAPRD